MTFADILDQVAGRYPNKLAVRFEGNSHTYAQLRGRVHSLSGSLLALGLRKGDRIAVMAPNCHQYVELYLATARAGFVIVPLNTRLVMQELEFILEDCQPAAIAVEGEFLDCLEALRPRLGSVKLFLHIGRGFNGSLDYEELARKDLPFSGQRAEAGDLLCILYTGGTTGFPKGVASTNRNWLANTLNAYPVIGVGHDDVNLVMTPLFHTAAVWPVLLHLYVGGTTVITRRFEVGSCFRAIERNRVTFCHPVLSQLVSMVEDPECGKYDLTSLKTVQCSMNLPVPVFRRTLQVFGNVVVPGYGLTEAGPMVTLMPRHEMASWEDVGRPNAELPGRYGSCGAALPNVEVRLVDEGGSEVPRGEVGEIAVKSEGVMRGYWKRPDATAQALRDGWLHTGDMARMDSAGFVYFVDRKSGMIKTGGESVYPKEVEDAIASHPAVLEVAVFGVPDKRWGETVKALVALRRGATATAEELIEHCRQGIASYKKPTSIDFVDALPRNPSGKVIKAELWARHASNASS